MKINHGLPHIQEKRYATEKQGRSQEADEGGGAVQDNIHGLVGEPLNIRYDIKRAYRNPTMWIRSFSSAPR